MPLSPGGRTSHFSGNAGSFRKRHRIRPTIVPDIDNTGPSSPIFGTGRPYDPRLLWLFEEPLPIRFFTSTDSVSRLKPGLLRNLDHIGLAQRRTQPRVAFRWVEAQNTLDLKFEQI